VRSLTFGFTPCPNDAFAFHALVHGLVEASFAVEPVLLDIEELNQRARTGRLDLTKLSFGAAPAARERYRLLRSGAALGHGVGPLVVAREVSEGYERIAVPGRDTTAFLLLRLAWPEHGDVVEMRYDEILEAVESGAVDAGLIIHESRFTYAEHGLVKVVDLGEWWEAETGLPVPLAGIYAREGVPTDEVEHSIRASVEYAFAHPEASREYVREHSHELSEDVCRAHIELYVNEFSVDLGEPGLAAIERLASASLAA
jgi:5,8-dihydroxy-2-naphthoate synthase